MLVFISPEALAASKSLVWENPGHNHPLKQMEIRHFSNTSQRDPTPSQPENISSGMQLKPTQTLHYLDATHTRYQQYYQNIPVWGYQIIFHRDQHKATFATGEWIDDIGQDIPSIHPSITQTQSLEIAFSDYKNRIETDYRHKHMRTSLVIYFDETQNRAHLAYHIQFFATAARRLSFANYMIEAHDGKVLAFWDGLPRKRVGQGLGGNSLNFLSYRAGLFQYGNTYPGIRAFAPFDVTHIAGRCIMQNRNIMVVNVENEVFPEPDDVFPVGIEEEKEEGVKPFSYACNALSQYINADDNGYAPVNHGYSPINDTMFFAQAVFDMYQSIYGVKQPLGTDLPIRAYTHIGKYDNGFALPPIYENGRLIAHQQIVLGNGYHVFAPLTQDTIPHELAHNVTANFSKLIYANQSGGINEAYSDMAGIALLHYLSQKHPWFWNGKDWTVSHAETLNGQPIRYMDAPRMDGCSIDNAIQYPASRPRCPYNDPHHTSGVFNKAFYLISQRIGITKAFQIMTDANLLYWYDNTNFNYAACGVIQAAMNRGYDMNAVIGAFNQVGVSCRIGIMQNGMAS